MNEELYHKIYYKKANHSIHKNKSPNICVKRVTFDFKKNSPKKSKEFFLLFPQCFNFLIFFFSLPKKQFLENPRC